MGNRESETRTKAGVTVTTTYAYDANDRLEGEVGSDGTTISYAYDDNGSLTGKQDAAGTSVYSYDGDRRLVDAITPNAGMSYRYDANGIRQSQTVNGITTRFVVDPTAQYAQVLEERSSTGNVLYLLGDDRIARTQGGQTRYLHTDGLGSTRLLTDGTTVATDRWWYEAFGEVESQTGTSSNAFLFAGEQLDPNLGHYYLRARYMDPANGRFTQMDVFSGYDTDPVSLHKYLYAHASPVSYSDPSGYFVQRGELQVNLMIRASIESIAPPLMTRTLAAKSALDAIAATTGTYTLANAAVRTVVERCIAKSKSGQTGCVPPFALFFIGDDYPEIRDHVGDAIADGKLSMLSRKDPPHGRGWLQAFKGAGKICNGGPGTQCDEYPWAASLEGGPSGNVSLRSVNGAQNGGAGSQLRWFHQRCKIPANTPSRKYKVVPMRGLPVTGYVCSK